MSTACARYKVRKFIPASAPHGCKGEWRYQCEARSIQSWYQEIGPWLNAFADAQGFCERHVLKMQVGA